MAQRTNEAAVLLVISTDLTTEQIEAFIKDASLWVDEELAGSGMTTDRMELIERYLTCALIRLRDLGLASARWDDVSEQYQVDPQITDYLTRAAAFDPTGKIRQAFLPPKDTRRAQYRVGTGFVDET